MSTINRVFTYKLADDYLAQTGDLNKSAQWTYAGPDEFWIFLESETGKPSNFNFYTKEMNGDVIPVPLGCVRYHVVANNEPLLATLLGASELVDGSSLPQISETLPNGETYSRPANPMPDHTYDANEIYYDFNTQQWHFPWKQTWVEWENILTTRNNLLEEIELALRRITDYPQAIQTALQQYKSDLENIETIWAGYPAYKVWIPTNPLE